MGERPIAFFALVHFSGQGRVHTQFAVPGLARSMQSVGEGLASVREHAEGGSLGGLSSWQRGRAWRCCTCSTRVLPERNPPVAIERQVRRCAEVMTARRA